jgi:ribosomal protein S18 acetylase RimI-like enzyme
MYFGFMTKEEIKERFIVRNYRNGDFSSISHLWNITGLGNPRRGDNEHSIEESISIGGSFIVLEDKERGNIYGTSWMTYDGRRIHMHHFGLDPALQGNGLSILLLKESLDFVKSMNCQVKLEVSRSNHRAINLYKKAGFTYLGDYDVYIIRDVSLISTDQIF